MKNRWALVVLAISLCAGIGISVYLTRFHEIEMYGDQSATLSNCPRTETTNCEVVNTSGYSEIAGVPISALGIPTYLLLLGLIVASRRRPRLLSHVFSIGSLTVLYSAYLYYVSTVKIGFLCAWCFRLYGVNLSVPVLAALAAWRNPLDLLGEGIDDLRRFRPQVRAVAVIFASLLVMTVLGDRLYRARLSRPAPQEASAAGASPAATSGGPPAAGAGPPGAASPATPPLPANPAATAPFVIPAPLKVVEGRKGGVEEKPFDLQARIGKGRPVALLFWAPGYTLAESGLVTLSRFMKDTTPQIDLFAVAGRREDQRVEMIWEAFRMLGHPPDLPLLLDEGFAVSTALGLSDVPNLVLLDGRGVLVTAKLKGLRQIVTVSPRPLSGEQVIRLAASGATIAPLTTVPPYYPAMELYGRCAPSFTLPEVLNKKDFTFTGRSANGRPTLLIFWSATCKHCQKEIPQILRHMRAHPGEINIVSVALIKPDRPDGMSHRKVTEAYIRTNGIPWTVLDDESGLASDLYSVISTPTTFLLTPAGAIVDAWYHPHGDIDAAFQQAIVRIGAARAECSPGPPERPMRASFSMADPDGRTVALDSVTGRPSIVHLWATWCVPCQTELPNLLGFREALERMGGRLVLVSVEADGAAARISEFGGKLGPGFMSYRAPRGGLADDLDLAYSVPRTFLVSQGGGVVRILYGAQKWEDPSFRETIRDLLQLRKN